MSSSYRSLARYRPFVNRTSELAELKHAMLTTQESREHRILVRYGVGGQGKTALGAKLQRFFSRDEPYRLHDGSWKRIRIARIDLEMQRHRQAERALLDIRLQLGVGNNGRFPLFDTLFARYQLLLSPGTDLRQAYPQLFAGNNEFLEDLLSIAGDEIGKVPGLSTIYKLTCNLRKSGTAWWRRRGRTLLNDLDELTADELLLRMPTYLGADLVDLLERADAPRICILVDSHEALWRESIGTSTLGRVRLDEWLRNLFVEARGCVGLIFSRERLDWEKSSPIWRTILDQKLLEPFIPAHIGLMLSQGGIEPGEIARKIVEAADGLPFYAAVQIEQHQVMAAAGLKPQASDFGGSNFEVLSRFVDHLSDHDGLALRLASYPRTIDEPLFLDLCERFLGGRAAADWTAVAGRSFAREQGDQIILHNLMRDHLQSREADDRPTLYREIHRFLYERARQSLVGVAAKDIGDKHVSLVERAAFHHLEADRASFANWVAEAAQPFEEAGRYAVSERLLTTAAAEPGLAADMRWNLMMRAAAVVQFQGRNEEARKLFLASLALLNDGTKDVRTRLLAISGVADCHYGMFHLAAAERLYRLCIRQSEDADVDGEQRATLFGSYGNSLSTLERFDEAERYIIRAIAVGEQALGHEAFKVANWHDNLGMLLHRMGRFDEARPHYVKAVEMIEHESGSSHPEVARLKGNIGRFLYDTGSLGEAERFAKEAEVIGRASFGGAHPHLAGILETLALIYVKLSQDHPDRLSIAEGYAREAVVVGTAGMRLRDVRRAHLLNTLGIVLRAGGSFREAKWRFRQAIVIYCGEYGSNSEWVAVALSNLGQVFSLEGDKSRAAEFQKKSVAIFEVKGSTRHANFARILTMLAQDLLALNLCDGALNRAVLARDILKDILPSHHNWRIDIEDLISAIERKCT